jgi:cytochrome P450
MVDRAVTELLDTMSLGVPPIDFHSTVSYSLPRQVLLNFLGVPLEDHEKFQAWSAVWGRLMHDPTARDELVPLRDYMRDLVQKKADCRDSQDRITELLPALDSGKFTIGELTSMSAAMVFFGHEPTHAAISKAMLLLLTHESQWKSLVADPTLAARATEEILRARQPLPQAQNYRTVGIVRYAHKDVVAATVTIKGGDMVIFSKVAANHDPVVFEDPERFDVTRTPNPHIAFGHGSYFCPGAALARLEIGCLLRQLAPRFPNMRLAVPLNETPSNTPWLTARPSSVMVTW